MIKGFDFKWGFVGGFCVGYTYEPSGTTSTTHNVYLGVLVLQFTVKHHD